MKSRICEDEANDLFVYKMIFLILAILAVTSAEIQWRNYEEGIKEMSNDFKPGLVLIYRPTCPACKHLQSVIQKSEEIEELSKQLVMIRCDEGHAPRDIDYRGGRDCFFI